MDDLHGSEMTEVSPADHRSQKTPRSMGRGQEEWPSHAVRGARAGRACSGGFLETRLLHSLRHDSIPLSPLWRNLWGLLIPPGGAGFGVLKAKQNGTEAVLRKSTDAKLPGALRFRLFPVAC